MKETAMNPDRQIPLATLETLLGLLQLVLGILVTISALVGYALHPPPALAVVTIIAGATLFFSGIKALLRLRQRPHTLNADASQPHLKEIDTSSDAANAASGSEAAAWRRLVTLSDYSRLLGLQRCW